MKGTKQLTILKQEKKPRPAVNERKINNNYIGIVFFCNWQVDEFKRTFLSFKAVGGENRLHNIKTIFAFKMSGVIIREIYAVFVN